MGSRDTAIGIFGGKYNLPEGTKTLQIYFPWGSAGVLRYLELDDGSSVIPTVRPNRMLIFGDSITQGYDAVYPSHSYAAVLADHLNADARNKGIGGDFFCPGLIDEEETTDPNYITVAYGTNDWYFKTPEEIESNAREFYGKLAKLYPNAKIFAITPIWRISEREKRPGGDFAQMASVIRRAAEGLANVNVIEGYNLVPHDPKLFLDGGLHPAESGFAYYAERLFAKIKEYI
jgi:lysophospholipase L1-like esterase